MFTKETTPEGITYYKGVSRGSKITVSVFGGNRVGVHLENAASKAWRGMGKFFPNIDLAAAAYKPGPTRDFILAVKLDHLPANVVLFSKP